LNNAFYGCETLNNIIIPNSVQSINGSFCGCKSLTSIVIPDSIEHISAATFHGCAELAKVTLSNKIKEIDLEAFSSCTSLESIVVPASIKTIHGTAFNDCSSLSSIKFEGNAPELPDTDWAEVFGNVEATAFYPANDVTWTPDVKDAFGGRITWVPYNIYTLDVYSSPIEGGTVVGGGCYGEKSTVNVTAVANEGYKFVKWMKDGNSISTEKSYSFSIDKSFSLTAVFEPINYVAEVTIDNVSKKYETFSDAIISVSNTVESNRTVVKLLSDIDLGEKNQKIFSGVFTIDLNGNEISSTCSNSGTLSIFDDTSITVVDSGEGGTISGCFAGIEVLNTSTVTINGGVIKGDKSGVYSWGNVIIKGGVISGETGIYVLSGEAKVEGGTIEECVFGIAVCGEVSIEGGKISGDNYDITFHNSGHGKVSVAENEIAGVIFPNGISVSGTTLANLLSEGVAFWKDGKQVPLNNYQTEISGGDVVVKSSDPIANHFINISALPSNAGVLTGGGFHEQNATVTVTAIVNEGYVFKGWMENGIQVSTNSNYTFTADTDRTLIAVFEERPIASSIKIFKNGIEIENDTIYIPETGTEISYYDAVVYDQYGKTMENVKVDWHMPFMHIGYGYGTGMVFVSYSATREDTVKYIATCDNVVVTIPIVVKKGEPRTIIYTDGVEGETIFEDKQFNVTHGYSTPSFGESPVRQGYTFLGWNPDVITTIIGDQVYTAVWKANTYNVTWINGAETYTTNIQTYKEKIVLPANVPNTTQSGCKKFVFDGWFTEANGGEKITGEKMFMQTESVCYYAHFAEYENHIDEDVDHNCDRGCGKKLEEHKDSVGDGDHLCDYCKDGEKISECIDIDPIDNKCDECGDYIGITVSGLIISFDTISEPVFLRLLCEDKEISVITSTDGSYEFSSVVPGEYVIEIYKENHTNRKYFITVGNENIMTDFKIHLKGDVNGDGRVNTTDVGLANAHAKKTNILEDYAFVCADINNDGKVNTTDVGRMNAHAKKTSVLW